MSVASVEVSSLSTLAEKDLRDFEKQTLETQNSESALQLATHFLDRGTGPCSKAVAWLCHAHDFLTQQGKSLCDALAAIAPRCVSHYPEKMEGYSLRSFFENHPLLTEWTCTYILCNKNSEELAVAMTECSSITKVSCTIPTEDSEIAIMAQRIEMLLTKATSVTHLSICSPYIGPTSPPFQLPNPQFVMSTAHALQVNTSVLRLSITRIDLTDLGVEMIVRAILENTSSGVRKLDLINCNIMNAGAKHLLTLLNSRPEISHIKLSGNPDIDPSLTQKIKRIVK